MGMTQAVCAMAPAGGPLSPSQLSMLGASRHTARVLIHQRLPSLDTWPHWPCCVGAGLCGSSKDSVPVLGHPSCPSVLPLQACSSAGLLPLWNVEGGGPLSASFLWPAQPVT